MSDQVTEVNDVEALVTEIGRLRAHVAQLEQHIQQLDQLAHQDTLISLPNRRGFMRELERLVDRAARYGHRSAMLFVDLDGLKMINDTFGHGAGDEALIQVADLLSRGVRRSDVVARIGGDEFGILIENADQTSAHDTANRLADLICDCEFSHDGDSLPLSVAIGVAMIDGEDTPAQVMARADEEMYRRKAAA
ncbi:GGDEF domain-containing protein [Sphingomonas hankyongi]|uniref:diguanylate cyclase n=1 Tax=Sphingomonas hankyongi TaxID=2908209 RepID=A0ABT0S058_9SPHN|nr:GGDEF domain-containing protein [Sphingomonas hankyongi]MCL6729239.1 GGDEF domain-containing protein [Sphingomonas hankyongi]